MTAPASRRGLILGLAALPLAGDAAVATTSGISDAEARLLAIGPRLVGLLDRHDRLYAPAHAAYEAWERAGEHLPVPRWSAMKDLPEWYAYLAAREPADAVAAIVEPLFEPFIDISLNTLPAIMLRHRYGMTFEAFREDALDDLDRLWRRAC